MLRNLVIVALCAVASAAIPILYSGHRDTLHAPVRPPAEPGQATGTAPGSRPVSPVAAPSGRVALIAADAFGHFKSEFRMNGRRVVALVDTGATYVALNRTTARNIGLALSQADFRHELDTANGRTRAAAVTIPRIEIGRIRLENIEAVVLEDRALSGALVGMSFLKRLDRFGVENGALRLSQ